MMKKIFAALLGITLLVAIGCGAAWLLNGERWQQEYAAFRKTGAPVLMYHAVGDEEGTDWPASLIMKPQLFESHLRYLTERGYTIVSVEQLAYRLERGESVDKYVALSFDDGYKNNYSVVLPLLQKYGAKGSFFVINREMGDELHMNEQEIKALIDAGMELGSHTYSHNPLAKIEEKYLVWELDTSRYWLKKKFDGYIVRTLAYPNGSYNSTVVAAAKKYGFYRALTGHVGVNTADTYKRAPLEMYRVTVADDGNGLEGFKRRLEQAYFWGFLQTKGVDINIVRDLVVQ
ncbi:MAG: polysaccharide deacetylase family protein [Phascolarctobacterium sp.]|uniref:polysaccharide deacetylase family protein n=1 Tax=Phascolarctobacterium sp. TaxID=2049039 RepID=UPI0026DD6CBF|nr:polysaccharide deacetylase family protein [Phascolarctobacterium sp.]MDO4922279.1 polysaccharide deacetylase family protein [Phascolarctobacterium sp.]